MVLLKADLLPAGTCAETGTSLAPALVVHSWEVLWAPCTARETLTRQTGGQYCEKVSSKRNTRSRMATTAQTAPRLGTTPAVRNRTPDPPNPPNPLPLISDFGIRTSAPRPVARRAPISLTRSLRYVSRPLAWLGAMRGAFSLYTITTLHAARYFGLLAAGGHHLPASVVDRDARARRPFSRVLPRPCARG